MPVLYERQDMMPAQPDGRIQVLPRPAVNLAQRLTQLANSSPIVVATVTIVRNDWYLSVEGRQEPLGENNND